MNEMNDGAEKEIELERVRRELFCSDMGIPREMRGDVMAVAERDCVDNGGDFEEAVKGAYERMCGYAKGYGGISGVRITRGNRDDDEVLRRAFGLK